MINDMQFDFPYVESSNPIDTLEGIAKENKWPLEKVSDEEASMEVIGRWGQFNLGFVWQEEYQALLFSCTSDLRVPVEKVPAIKDMLFEINNKTWLGHFDLDDSDDKFVLFRYTSLMRGYTLGGQEHVEDLIELAMTEFDRFYPAFKAVLSERKIANDIMVTMLADPMGEA